MELIKKLFRKEVQEQEPVKDSNNITDQLMKQSVDHLRELQKAKWEEFKRKHSARITLLPRVGKKITVPAIWDPRLNDWVWVSRGQRRHLQKRRK